MKNRALGKRAFIDEAVGSELTPYAAKVHFVQITWLPFAFDDDGTHLQEDVVEVKTVSYAGGICDALECTSF